MKYSILVIMTILLGGCSSLGKNGDPLPQITFDHVRTYPLYVASYEPLGLVDGAIENMPEGFTANPAQIIHDYLASRFEAVGNQGKLVAKIRSMTITHEEVESQNSMSALVGVDKKDHYRVTATIDINARGVRGIEWQKQSLTVYRDIYISEHVSLVEREKIEMRAMDHMIDDLDIALRKILQDQFGVLRPQLKDM